MSERVFIAMSGGVDSSVSAYLLKAAGYDVAGIHLRLYQSSGKPGEKSSSELEETCGLLKIPLHYLNLEEEFTKQIINPFCSEYEAGRTPNPCVQCNRYVKFGHLLEKVKELGGDYMATGHYARIEKTGKLFLLKKGLDINKDQSYFLHVLGQKELAKVIFPFIEMLKSELKKTAERLGLPAAQWHESQDICFIPDNDSRAFLASHLNTRPGEIVDSHGKILGHHKGLAFYTIGQRQGMGVSSSQPLYVQKLEAVTNRLVVNYKSQLYSDSLTAECVNWVSGSAPRDGVVVAARVRYRSKEAEAILHFNQDKVFVSFAEPQWAITPGQSVVFYQGDVILGGGLIE